MPDNYMQDALKRVVAMQKEALVTLSPPLVDAANYWPFALTVFPYASNRLGAATYNYEEDPAAEDIMTTRRVILMRIVIDHIEAGVEGEKPDVVTQAVGLMEAYFLSHPMLTTNTGSYTEPPDYLLPEALIVSDTGIVAFDNRGLISNQLGVEFTLEIEYLREINLA
jgi:hypothetical protein